MSIFSSFVSSTSGKTGKSFDGRPMIVNLDLPDFIITLSSLSDETSIVSSGSSLVISKSFLAFIVTDPASVVSALAESFINTSRSVAMTVMVPSSASSRTLASIGMVFLFSTMPCIF